jgi:hypothetical protein
MEIWLSFYVSESNGLIRINGKSFNANAVAAFLVVNSFLIELTSY